MADEENEPDKPMDSATCEEASASVEASTPVESDAAPAASAAHTALMPTERREILHWMLQGASPFGACRKVGVSVFAFLRTLEDDATFRHEVDQVGDILAQNVAAAVYQAALKGSVPAQTLWLKHRLPPGWKDEVREVAGPKTFDELFDQLSNGELLELARAMGVDLPPEIAGTL